MNINEKTCIIVGAGEVSEEISRLRETRDFIIAADGGYNNLQKFDITPDLIIGDCDSINDIPQNIELIKALSEKDETDMELAVFEAIKRGYNRFLIYGGLGGRIDHALANIALIADLSARGYKAELIGNGEVIFAISNNSITFSSEEKGVISLFAFGGDARGVTIKGLKYPLENATLSQRRAGLGISNEFIGEEGVVEVKEGTVIVVRGSFTTPLAPCVIATR